MINCTFIESTSCHSWLCFQVSKTLAKSIDSTVRLNKKTHTWVHPFVQFVETQKNCVALNFISGFHLNVRSGGFLVSRYRIVELRFICTKRKHKIWNHCGTEIIVATTCQCLNINKWDKPRWLNNWNIRIHTKILMGCQISSSNHQSSFC